MHGSAQHKFLTKLISRPNLEIVMGKLKRSRKNQKSRLNPLQKEEPSSNSSNEQLSAKVLPLIKQLSSKVPNEKATALGSIVVISEDDKMRKLFLKEKLISTILEQCLNDSNDEIVVDSFGLLRNLAIDEGEGVIIHLWRSNIWTTIEESFKKIQHSFKFLAEKNDTTAKDSNHKAKITLLYTFAENLISLVGVMAGGSDDLYDKIIDKLPPISDFVIDLIVNQINSDAKFKVSTKLFNSCLEYINEFSQDSATFVENLISSDKFNLDQLFNYTKTQSSKLSMIYTEGIKFNYNDVLSQSSHQDQISQEILSNSCDLITDIDLNQFKQDFTNKDDLTITGQQQVVDSINAETKLQAALTDLTCVELALNIFTSTFEYLSVNENGNTVNLSKELISLLTGKVSQVLIALLQFELSNPNLTSLLTKLLHSLNNLIWLFLSNETLPVPWYETCVQLWNYQGQLSQIIKDEVALPLTILWGLAKSLGSSINGLDGTEFVKSQIEHITTLQEFTANEQDEEKINDKLESSLPEIGLLGSLSSILNTQSASKIGHYLLSNLEVCDSPKPLCHEVVVESLNSIYDLFGDKNNSYDQAVFVGENYIQKLTTIEPKIKSMYKKIDKKKYPDLKAKAEEAWVNLEGFIQYKQNE